jgi:hypothetical protein
MADKSARLVVLVDGENFPAKLAEGLLERVRTLGSVVETRIYGHYNEQTMSGWASVAGNHRFTRVDVKVDGPNSTDFQLTIEAMDMLHCRHLDGICIASSDRGFGSLALRVRSAAVHAYGFGEKKAKPEYRDSFDDFFEISVPKKTTTARGQLTKSLSKPTEPKKAETAKPTQSPATKTELTSGMILHAIRQVKQDEDGWVRLQQVGDFLRKNNPALPKTLHLWQRIQTITEVETKTSDRSHFVRARMS